MTSAVIFSGILGALCKHFRRHLIAALQELQFALPCATFHLAIVALSFAVAVCCVVVSCLSLLSRDLISLIWLSPDRDDRPQICSDSDSSSSVCRRSCWALRCFTYSFVESERSAVIRSNPIWNWFIFSVAFCVDCSVIGCVYTGWETSIFIRSFNLWA